MCAAENARERILEAAEEVFARQNTWTATLSEVLRVADQRNESAIRYHFGGRDGLIFALLERGREAEIRQRIKMLSAAAKTSPDLRGAVEILARPSCDSLRTQHGRRVRIITADVMHGLSDSQLADARPPEVAATLDLLAPRCLRCQRHFSVHASRQPCGCLWRRPLRDREWSKPAGYRHSPPQRSRQT